MARPRWYLPTFWPWPKNTGNLITKKWIFPLRKLQNTNIIKRKSSRGAKNVFLKTSQNSRENVYCSAWNFVKKRLRNSCFSVSEFFKNMYFEEHLRAAAFDHTSVFRTFLTGKIQETGNLFAKGASFRIFSLKSCCDRVSIFLKLLWGRGWFHDSWLMDVLL